MASEPVGKTFLADIREQFTMQKALADRAIAQLNDEDLHRLIDPEANSIAIIMKHIAGNAISRWTDLLTTDGEKPDRNRDGEFEDGFGARDEIVAYWEQGWQEVFRAIDSLTEQDILKTIYIRGEAHSVLKAIVRQISHYGYHVGQIVLLAKHFASEDWKSLTIPKKRRPDA